MKYLLPLVLLFSCTQIPVSVEKPEVPVLEVPAESVAETCPNKEWCFDHLVKPYITQKLLGEKPGLYCPKYAALVDKTSFWLAFSKAVTRAESNWNIANTYKENFTDHLTGELAQSVGLFQLSVGDKLNYKTAHCKDLSNYSLKTPEINVPCGLEIMNQLSGSRSTMQASFGRYWSTIRDNWNATDKVYLVSTVKKYIPECF